MPKTVLLLFLLLSADERHWAFNPLNKPKVPIGSGSNPLDAFIHSKLGEKGMLANPPAEKSVLLRRIYFDLIGLPPSPEEHHAFLSDSSPNAFGKVVDKLLASPRYGERWGRHWLDVSRFAESNGFEMNQARPNAWPYRDWVIRAFNSDLPYADFVKAQLAGDQLGAPEATGFLVAGSWDQVKSPDPVLTANQRADELHDMISVTGSAFLGLTVGCARCHHHKFDPIKQVEYYGWKAVFDGVKHGENAIGPPSVDSEKVEALKKDLARLEWEREKLEPASNPMAATPTRLRVDPKGNREKIQPTKSRFLLFRVNATNTGTEPCIDEIEVFAPGQKENLALSSKGVKATSSSNFPGSPLHKLEHINDGLFGNGKSWISAEAGKGWVLLEFPKEVEMGTIAWARDREGKYIDRLPTDYSISLGQAPDQMQVVASSIDRIPFDKKIEGAPIQQKALLDLENKKQELEKELQRINGPRLAYSGKFEQPGATLRFHRGDPTQPREAVLPSTLHLLHQPFDLKNNSPETARRIALGNWLTSIDNPLVWRVMANRVWQYHFGTGIVATPSDFGVNGTGPTNPLLLDWLACELRDNGGSLKNLHRLICHSNAYQRANRLNEKNHTLDAGASYLWRFPGRRLEAEPLRDTLLTVAGVLSQEMGGAGFDLFERNTNYVKVYIPLSDPGPDTFRRMVYQSKPRMQLDTIFGPFDCPDAGQTAPRRTSSTTPLQSLALWNSPFSKRMVGLFAERVRQETRDPSSQIQLAFLLAFSRPPTPEEEKEAVELINQFSLETLCKALINANEFLFIE